MLAVGRGLGRGSMPGGSIGILPYLRGGETHLGRGDRVSSRRRHAGLLECERLMRASRQSNLQNCRTGSKNLANAQTLVRGRFRRTRFH